MIQTHQVLKVNLNQAGLGDCSLASTVLDLYGCDALVCVCPVLPRALAAR